MSVRTSTSRARQGLGQELHGGLDHAGGLTYLGQKNGRITSFALPRLDLAKQSRHCFTFIQEGSHVTFRLGQGECFFQNCQGLPVLFPSLKSQRSKDEGFDYQIHLPGFLCLLEKPVG